MVVFQRMYFFVRFLVYYKLDQHRVSLNNEDLRVSFLKYQRKSGYPMSDAFDFLSSRLPCFIRWQKRALTQWKRTKRRSLTNSKKVCQTRSTSNSPFRIICAQQQTSREKKRAERDLLVHSK